MRLIDADKLEELCDIMSEKCGDIGESIWNQFRTTVECSPTIEAEPVRRGSEWQWCHDCKEYDKENHCCHRWSTMIRDTIEAMQIIRCKDCINFTSGKDEWGNCFENPMKMWRETDFCSWAERKDDETE